VTPGAYLCLRRTAAGLTLDDVALMTETTPPVSARSRAEWLGLIEADEMPIAAETVEALRGAFPFDPHVLIHLIAIHAGGPVTPPQLCRACGCSWNDACLDDHDQGCAWSAGDPTLCTACERNAVATAAA